MALTLWMVLGLWAPDAAPPPRPTACAWPLGGTHATLPCMRCHPTPDFAIAGDAGAGCARCHAPAHQDAFGAGCDGCHAPTRPFREVAFAHDTTGFPLEGAHRAPCATCHAPSRGDTRRARVVGCVGCHKDPHRGGAGLDCAQCHDGRTWLSVRFDHGATGFALDGRHRAVPCLDCHRGGRFVGQPDGCVFCHGDETPRGHRFPGRHDCGECHRTVSFERPHFEHLPALATSGVHRRVAKDCGRCHRGAPLDVDACPSCHLTDLTASHRAFLADGDGLASDCVDCHDRSVPWRAGVLLRHPVALVGGHATLPCSSCHPLPMAIRAGAEECRACHLRHEPRTNHPTGTDCVDCHTPAGFYPATTQ